MSDFRGGPDGLTVVIDPLEVIMEHDDHAAALLAAAAELDGCDAYIVLVIDPETAEVDAHGPFEGVEATLRADEFRRELDRDDLRDVLVRVSRLHRPRAVA